MPAIKPPPAELRDLFRGDTPLSKRFLAHTRTFNNAFAFASFGTSTKFRDMRDRVAEDQIPFKSRGSFTTGSAAFSHLRASNLNSPRYTFTTRTRTRKSITAWVSFMSEGIRMFKTGGMVREHKNRTDRYLGFFKTLCTDAIRTPEGSRPSEIVFERTMHRFWA